MYPERVKSQKLQKCGFWSLHVEHCRAWVHKCTWVHSLPQTIHVFVLAYRHVVHYVTGPEWCVWYLLVTAKHLRISLWFLMDVELLMSTGTHAYQGNNGIHHMNMNRMASKFVSSHPTIQVLLHVHVSPLRYSDEPCLMHLKLDTYICIHFLCRITHTCTYKVTATEFCIHVHVASHTCTLTCWNSKERILFNCSSRLVQDFLPEASTTIHKHCMGEGT